MAWTEAQLRAITTRDKNLLVAAAAGSGKTAVLVERIIGLIADEGVDADKLLVVTFTHAAAEEMLARIGAALNQKLAAEKDPVKIARLERQTVLLPSAAISTLHSFCLTVLRQNFHLIDLDPEFRLGLTEELRLICEDALEELLEQEYEEGREDFLRLADAFAEGGKDDTRLAALILDIYNFAQSRPFPLKWLNKVTQVFDLPPNAKLKDTVWYQTMQEEVELALTAALADNRLAYEVAEDFGFAVYAENLDEHRQMLENAFDVLYGDFDTLKNVFAAFDFALKAQRGANAEDKAVVTDARDRYKKSLGALAEKYFAADEATIVADLRGTLPYVRELALLVGKFAARFAASKREKNIADFADLEHFALKILMENDDEEKPVLSAAAKNLRERFAAVMVDEYQDTNGVQEMILSLVADPAKKNLFAVGDVKQSIYRFRLADPTLFLQKYHDYPKAGAGYERIDLRQNFRSRPSVLAAINFVFEQLMNEATMEMAYDEAARLYPGAQYPVLTAGATLGGAELNVIFDEESDEDASELKGIERETQLIADKLNELMATGTQVFDKEKKCYRPLRYRDAVILMRSVRGRAEKVLDVLKQNGIPAYAAMDAGFFAETEVRLMLSLLAIIDNARQDIPLAAVLLSSVGKFTTAELAHVRLCRLAAKEGAPTDEAVETDLFAALKCAADPQTKIAAKTRQKAARFLERLNIWRDIARELSVPELIAELYRQTGYYDYVGSLSGGTLRQANLRMLIDRAAEYEQTNFRSLFRFLRFVERMQNADTDLAVARTLSENEDVVRVMTIHKSKGLEFPLVFVAATGTKFGSVGGEIILHGELGLGPFAVDAEAAFRYPTFARHAVTYRATREERAEELRVLYVALTRAREKIIVVGTGGKAKKFADMLKNVGVYGNLSPQSKDRELPPYAPTAADSFLAWLAMCLLRDEKIGEGLRFFAENGSVPPSEDEAPKKELGGELWQVNIVPSSRIKSRLAKIKDDNVLMSVKNGEKLPPTDNRAEVERLLKWRYDYKGIANVPAKLSVTELKRRFTERDTAAADIAALKGDAEKRLWSAPKFLRPQRLSGADYGTIMHACLQHVDLAGDLSSAGIKKQLAVMRGNNIFNDDEIKAASPSKIAAFFASPLGQRMLAAPNKRRELPFFRRMAAQRFFPEAQGDEYIFVQGVIDLLFSDAKGTVLVDYKTDGTTTAATVRNRYRLQIDLYSAAIEEILQTKVTEKYLFMLHDASIVPL